MPALFTYLIAITLLIGGGYGGLSWLAAPDPTKIASNAPQKPSPPHPDMRQLQSTATDPAPQPSRSEPVSTGSSDEKAGSNDSNEKQPSPQPESGAVRGRQAEVEASAPVQDRPSPPANVQASRGREMEPRNLAPRNLESRNEVRQSAGKGRGNTPSVQVNKQTGKMALAARGDAQAPGNPPVGAAKTAKPRHVRDTGADRSGDHNDAEWRDRAEAEQDRDSAGLRFAGPRYRGQREYPRDRGFALMTLRTIEFPDGRRVSQLLPYRWMPHHISPHPGGDRFPPFEPDE
jgi:hypothetical protein